LHWPAARITTMCAVLCALIFSAAMLAGCDLSNGPTYTSGVPTTTATQSAPTTPTAPATPKPAPKAARKKPKTPKPSSASTGTAGQNNSLLAWNFQRNKKHTVPGIPSEARRLAKQYGAMYVGPDPKLVYLTFDEGYENGNTPKILDALKRNDVRATFFVSGEFCREAPKLCRRMLAEGHVVGNHSNTHPSMPSVTSDPKRFEAQLSKTETSFTKATGQPIARLFRPPMGEYSARSLAMTEQLGYTSVFWSFAHVDYDEKNQPPVATTVSRVLAGSHPGAIFLLHGISTSDTGALDEIIKGLRAQGYEFGTLEPR
jgi:peptidoglycan-N-acetylmuramic acid deacetylase